MTITLSAHAKLNLLLRLGGSRPDGYHTIYSVFQSISLADEITVTLGSSDRVTTELMGYRLPTDSRNLAIAAAESFWRRLGRREGTHIRLNKHIPIGRGLGGGSADAAAVLLGLNLLSNSPLSDDELAELGAIIGSDVPFCLRGGTVCCTGRGEVMKNLPDAPYVFLIINPPFGVSTKWAYAEWDRVVGVDGNVPNVDMIAGWENHLGDNDFERAVFPRHPILQTWKDSLRERGASAAGLSGSGSALFGVYRQRADAENAASLFLREGVHTIVAESVPKGVEVWKPSLSPGR